MANFTLPMSLWPGNTRTTLGAFSARIPVFFHLVLGVVSCFTALCVIAGGVGRLESPGDPITGIDLDRCGGTFCYKDVSPGVTPWSTAMDNFALLKHRQLFEHQIYVPIGVNGGAALYPSTDGHTVGLVYMAVPSDNPVKIGDIVNRFGPPCALTLPFNLDNPTLTLFYPRMRVIAQLSRSYLEVSTPVEYIALGDPAEQLNMSSDLCRGIDLKRSLPTDTTRAWQGFKFLSSYLGQE